MLYSNFELGKGGPMIALKENVQVDVRKFEEIGYTVQRRQFWQYDVVSSSGETVLEVVLLPETALAMSRKKVGNSNWFVVVTVEQGLPVANCYHAISSGKAMIEKIWATR